MSKILFVENRFRTDFWIVMAQELYKNGHSIYWIVQNQAFKPSLGNNFVIGYPGKRDMSTQFEPEDIEIGKSDRNINHFKYKDISYYPYYRRKISQILDQTQPDIVFGESTLFHELITIDLCKKRSILYLHPGTCRFPTGRFSFYKYDSLEPFAGSENRMSKNEAISLINNIADRKVAPDYMKKKKILFRQKIKRIVDLIRLSLEYYKGEHFNTPNPTIKRQIEKEKRRVIQLWEEMVRNKEKQKKTISVLYPLQYQPEANLDVWGRSRRNQLNLIKELRKNLDDDVELYIKPNPKSKYEISEDMINYISKAEGITPISHAISMTEIFSNIDLVITVTGTIAIECILSGKPIITLHKTLNNNMKSCIYLETLECLNQYIDLLRKEEFPEISMDEKIDYINHINSTSYKGIPSQSYLNKENIEVCTIAFKDVVNKITLEE